MWNEFLEDESSGPKGNELCFLDCLDSQPSIAARVVSLTQQLGDDDCDIRDNAQNSIIALGPCCLPLLTCGLKHPDPEIRRRANAVVHHYLDMVSERAFTDEDLSPQAFASTSVGVLTQCSKAAAMSEKEMQVKVDVIDNLQQLSMRCEVDSIAQSDTRLELLKQQYQADAHKLSSSAESALRGAIYVSGDGIASDDELKVLKNCTFVTELTLEDCPVTDKGLFAVSLPNLVHLDISGTFITDRSLAHVSKVAILESLQANRTDITDAGIVALAGLQNLHTLSLRNTAITDESVSTLSQLKSLVFLDISQTSITDKSIAELAKLKDMNMLNLPNAVSGDAIRALHEKLPNSSIFCEGQIIAQPSPIRNGDRIDFK
jgi:hypothetical protein